MRALNADPAELLRDTSHRPWALPSGNWSFYQEWNDAVFLHWKVEREMLRSLVPRSLELDQIDGSCWVSVVAFTMQRIRPRGLPALSFLSDFHELNVRTYVRRGDMAGVWFLSIEAANRMSCWIARRLSALPYVYAPMHRNDYLFTARSEPLGVFSAQYRLGSVMDRKDEVDRWLTERYALFQEKGPHLYRYQTHHREWPIHACEVPDPIHAPKRWPRLFAGHPARAHYSTGVAVLTWAAERC